MSRLPVLFLFTVTLAACGGSEIEGDWFNCENADCSMLDSDGIRFRDDGTFVALDAEGGELEANEQYCEETRANDMGRYKTESGKLTVTEGDGDVLTFGYDVDGDRLTLTMPPNDRGFLAARIFPTRSSGPCP